MRLRTQYGLMRSRFLEALHDGWKIAAPVVKDAYVPIEVGADVKVEAPTEGGAYLFRTKVVSRDSSDHTLLLAKPEKWTYVDRRCQSRSERLAGQVAHICGAAGVVVNTSRNGASLLVCRDFANGDGVTVELPGGGQRFGWVLETLPDVLDGRPASRVRVCFGD